MSSNPWKEAVVDALVNCWALSSENVEDPRRAVEDLVRREVKWALDPLISKAAHDLIEKGRKE